MSPRHDRIAFTTGNDGGRVVIGEQPGTINLRIVKLDAATNAGHQVGASLAGAEFTCVAINPLDGHKSSRPTKAVGPPSPMSP